MEFSRIDSSERMNFIFHRIGKFKSRPKAIHPNVIMLYDIVVDSLSNKFYYIYEYCDCKNPLHLYSFSAGTLRDKISWPNPEGFSETQILNWFTSMCLGVLYFDKKEKTLCDIRPERIRFSVH